MERCVSVVVSFIHGCCVRADDLSHTVQIASRHGIVISVPNNPRAPNISRIAVNNCCAFIVEFLGLAAFYRGISSLVRVSVAALNLHSVSGTIKQVFQKRNALSPTLPFVGTLDKQLGQFLKSRRGGMTFAQFSRKVGLPPSTLHRLENGTQSLTLKKLEQLLKRLKCQVSDIFPD